MSNPHEQFTEVWHAEAPRVLAFASRHVGTEAAHDVVAETFMTAWRRGSDASYRLALGDCPEGGPKPSAY